MQTKVRVMTKNNSIIVDEDESALAILLLNSAIPIWNWRERRSAPLWFKASWPVAGIEFIADPSFKVCFRHLASGRIYAIVAPGYEPYVTKPRMSCLRVPLDPKLVRRVERLVGLETPSEREPNTMQLAGQFAA
jgi:hypothetical protein